METFSLNLALDVFFVINVLKRMKLIYFVFGTLISLQDWHHYRVHYMCVVEFNVAVDITNMISHGGSPLSHRRSTCTHLALRFSILSLCRFIIHPGFPKDVLFWGPCPDFQVEFQ
jgi:hypothetical protein